MNLSRRNILIVTTVAVAACDILFLGARGHKSARNFAVTYAGADSLSSIVPASRKAAAFQDGQWVPTLAETQIPTIDMSGGKRDLYYITLAPYPTYAHFLAVVRDLKTRGKCNIAIRESGKPIQSVRSPGDAPSHDLDVPALVLCGNAIGDAGFIGVLPRDGIVHLDVHS